MRSLGQIYDNINREGENKNKMKNLSYLVIGIVLFSIVIDTKQEPKTWLDELSVSEGSKKLKKLGFQKPDSKMSDQQYVDWAKNEIYSSMSGY
jgi:hypothetical protein